MRTSVLYSLLKTIVSIWLVVISAVEGVWVAQSEWNTLQRLNLWAAIAVATMGLNVVIVVKMMSVPRCPICRRMDDMEPCDAGGWVCRNPPCCYQRALEKVQGRPDSKSET